MSTTRLHTCGEYPDDWPQIATGVKQAAGMKCIRCSHPHDVASGYVLTVHHFDGNKSNCRWWNLMALCQRCHLKVQGKVNPFTPYFLEHSQWAKPYVAGFYSALYKNFPEISRENVMEHLEELLALERLA